MAPISLQGVRYREARSDARGRGKDVGVSPHPLLSHRLLINARISDGRQVLPFDFRPLTLLDFFAEVSDGLRDDKLSHDFSPTFFPVSLFDCTGADMSANEPVLPQGAGYGVGESTVSRASNMRRLN